MKEKPEPLGKYLSIAYKAYFSLIDEKLKEYPIGAEELHLLIPLYKEGTLSQKRLCEIFPQNKTTIARRLERLENYDFIRREEDPKDRRRKLIHLTPKSERRRQEFHTILHSIETELQLELSQEEICQFLQTMKKICQILKQGETKK